MPVDTTWSPPSTAAGSGGLDLTTGQVLTQTVWERALSDLNRLGGADGNTKTGPWNLGGVSLKGLASTVSTTAVIITSGGTPGFALVYGSRNGSTNNNFVDLVVFNASRATVITTGSQAVETPDARTYSVNGSNLQVAMAANTYSVQVLWVNT